MPRKACTMNIRFAAYCADELWMSVVVFKFVLFQRVFVNKLGTTYVTFVRFFPRVKFGVFN